MASLDGVERGRDEGDLSGVRRLLCSPEEP